MVNRTAKSGAAALPAEPDTPRRWPSNTQSPRGTVVGGDLEGVPDRDHSGEVETAGRQGLTGSGEQVDSGGHIETGGQPTTASVFWMVAYPLVFEVPDSEAMPHQGPRPDWRPGRHSKPSARTRHG